MFDQEDLRGELFDKIGAQQTGSPLETLNQGIQQLEGGHHHEAQKLFNKVVELTQANTTRLMDQKQHRAAAEEWYIQGLAFEKLEKTDERNVSYQQSSDSLLNASKTAINFGEDNTGITYIALSGLVCLMLGDEEKAFQIYNDGMETTKDKPNSQALINLLYALGYLLDGLRNTNVAALTDAQNYISTDLKPMLKGSKLQGFETLLNSVVGHTRDIIESRVKMPKIVFSTDVPKDLLLNMDYDLEILVENVGEGPATNIKLELVLPESLEILEGESTQSRESIEPTTSFSHKIKFRLQNAEMEEVTEKITGSITFDDMMSNSRKQGLGDIELEFRSKSKATEFTDRLQLMNEQFEKNKASIDPSVPQALVTQIDALNMILNSEINTSVEDQDFEKVKVLVDHLESIQGWYNATLSENEGKTNIVVEIEERMKTYRGTIHEDLTKKFTTEKFEAVEENTRQLEIKFSEEKAQLTDRLEREKNEAIEEIKSTLETSFKEEKDALAKYHTEEVDRINKANEGKLKQQLIQVEEKVRQETAADIQKKNDEIETAIREIQEEHQQELSKEIENLKAEMTSKYQVEIDNLKQEIEEQQERNIKTAYEDKEQALKTQMTKSNQEKELALDELRRELESRHSHDISESIEKVKQDFNRQIKQKDAIIEDLQNKINILNSSSE